MLGTAGARGGSRRRLGLAILAALPLLLGAASASAEPGPEVPPHAMPAGSYLDPLGRHVDFEPVYQGWFGPRRKQYPLRAAAENVALLGLEVAIYWYDPSTNVVDWQFPSLGSKLTSRESFRFDDNLLTTNYVFHPFAGTLHYVATRSNGYGVGMGLLAAAGSSAIYELLLEWKELVSINDLIVTPLGGAAMGEFFNQLGDYLNSEPAGAGRHVIGEEVVHQGVKSTIGLPRDVHNAIDDPAPPPSVAPDNLGLSSAYWHRFRVLAAQQIVDAGSGPATRLFGIDGSLELAAMPGFGRVGRFGRFFASGNFTSFVGRLSLAGQAHDAQLTFDSHLFGHYVQDFAAAGSGKRGQANEIALAVGLDYFKQSLPGWRDEYGIVHLLKPTERVFIALGPVQLNAGADVALDFASLHSGAYEIYVGRYGLEGAKSSLVRHGYAHSWGLSAGAFFGVKAGPIELGAQARTGHYESIDGLERFQEVVTRDQHGTESVTRVGGYARVEPTSSLVAGKIELVRDSRGSSYGQLVEKRGSLRFGTGLGVRF